MIYNSFADFLLKEWLQLYRQAPKLTAAATVAAVITTASVAYFVDRKNQEQRAATRLEQETYSKQVAALDQTRANLQALIDFVDFQKQQLERSERALIALRQEQQKLKPLLDADRKAIDALFAAQEARNQESQQRERWIGFGLGILASLIASLVWAIVVYLSRRKTVAKT